MAKARWLRLLRFLIKSKEKLANSRTWPPGFWIRLKSVGCCWKLFTTVYYIVCMCSIFDGACLHDDLL